MEIMLEKILCETVVGIDAEWKPNFLAMTEQYTFILILYNNLKKITFRVALIQIALPKIVYLVDVVNLDNKLSESQWLHFFEILLCSQKIRKIGKLVNFF